MSNHVSVMSYNSNREIRLPDNGAILSLCDSWYIILCISAKVFRRLRSNSKTYVSDIMYAWGRFPETISVLGWAFRSISYTIT